MSNKSTLTLLEHINLNVPNHNYILDFYISILGMGLDPRHAQNVQKGSGTIWANCGASQFHLPFGEEAQVIPGHIGLLYDDLSGVLERLELYSSQTGNRNENENENEDGDKNDLSFSSFSVEGRDDDGMLTCIKITYRYGNVFYCRKRHSPSLNANAPPSLMDTAKQPIVYSNDNDHLSQFQTTATKYGLSLGTEMECKGISYVEFYVPKSGVGNFNNISHKQKKSNSSNNNNSNDNKGKGKKKKKNHVIDDIAEFYDCVFDAPCNVIEVQEQVQVPDGDSDTDTNTDTNTSTSKIAMIGFGAIDPTTGRASQSLLFREVDDNDNKSTIVKPYDGHHKKTM